MALTWGIVGIVLALVAVGLLLWRERGKRAAAERNVENLKLAHENQTRRLLGLGGIAAQKEKRIRELEERLASKDPGALFDDTFGGLRRDSEDSGSSD